MRFSSRTWVWILVIVVVVAALCLAWFNSWQNDLVYAPQGQVIAGFPQNLLIDSSAQIGQSYSSRYSSAGDQYVVAWTSQSSPQILAVGYNLYLPSHGWSVLSASSSANGAQGISAQGSLGMMDFSAAPSGTGSAVLLTYVPNESLSPMSLQSLPSGFPEFLSVDPNAQLLSAESNASSEIVTLVSSEDITSLASAFSQSLASQKWSVSSGSGSVSGSTLLVATDGQSGATILLLPFASNDKTEVQVVYNL